MKWKLFLSISLALAAPAVAAQSQPPLAPVRDTPDPAALVAARELLSATNFDAQFEQSARLTAQASFTTVLEALEQQHQSDFPEQLEQEVRQILAVHIDQTIALTLRTAREDTAAIYARYFSAEEIRELLRLQTNPVMVRYNQVAPALIAELTQIGLAAEVQRQPELEQRIREVVDAWLISAGPGHGTSS